jgi:hypothetical protein
MTSAGSLLPLRCVEMQGKTQTLVSYYCIMHVLLINRQKHSVGQFKKRSRGVDNLCHRNSFKQAAPCQEAPNRRLFFLRYYCSKY